MEQQIRAVLFDMDGLMFDTERLGDEVWRAVAGKYGVTMTPEDVSLLRGRNYESGRRAFLERFGAGFSDDDYDTIGGLVTEAIGHLPEIGDELTLDRFVFRVARANARRVQAFHVTVLPPDPQEDA